MVGVDGRIALVRGLDLNGYLSAGIRTDHETTSAEEALEKIRKGMTVLIREGSVSKDLHALAPLLTVATSPFLALCTDDRKNQPKVGLEIIRGCAGLNLVGCDLVEVSPPYDPSGNTAMIAANFLYEMLCVLPDRRTR